MSIFDQKGFSMNMAILAGMFVFIMGIGLISVTRIGQKADRLAEDGWRASTMAYLGIERGQSSLVNDRDWGDNAVTLFDAVPYEGGAYTVTLSNITTYNVTMTAVGTFGERRYRSQKNISRKLSDQFFLSISTENAGIPWPSYDQLENVELSNSHPSANLTVDKVRLFWLPDTGEKIQAVQIGGVPVWTHDGIGTPTTRQFSGVLLDMVDVSMVAGGSIQDFIADFDSNMSGKAFSLYVHLSDGSVAHADFAASDISDMAASLDFDTFNTSLTAGGKTVNSLDAVNSNAIAAVSVVEVNFSWIPELGEHLEKVKSGGILWSGFAASGVTVDIIDMSVNPSDMKPMSFEFDSEMRKIFTMRFKMSDDTVRSYDIDFRTGQYLEINGLSSSVDPDTVLGGVVLTNNDNRTISITKMTVAVDPDVGQSIVKVESNDTTVFSGSVASGAPIDIVDVAIGNAGSVETKVFFDASVAGSTFTVTYEMDDLSTSTNVFSVSTQAGVTQIGFDDAFLTPSLTALKGIFLTNSSSVVDVDITGVSVGWTPDDGMQLTELWIDLTKEWFNLSGSDPLVSVTGMAHDLDIGEVNRPNTYSFDLNTGTSINKDFFLVFSFGDGSQKGVTINLNPASHIAGDNAESGDWASGSGFIGDWSFGGTAAANDGAAFSGAFAFKLSGTGSWMQRNVDLSFQSSARLKFKAKLANIPAGENIYLKISDDNKLTWQTLKTWGDGDDTAVYEHHDFDLSGFTLSSDFYVSFECESTGASISVDEIYISE
ncbi:MAG: hypothetical protein ACI9BD_000005 [Candidatus Marinamargulisbacteria bacterium]|jgi:hypothetical protein